MWAREDVKNLLYVVRIPFLNLKANSGSVASGPECTHFCSPLSEVNYCGKSSNRQTMENLGNLTN